MYFLLKHPQSYSRSTSSPYSISQIAYCSPNPARKGTEVTLIPNMDSISQPIEISFPLPKAPHAILHCQLTFLEACSLIHLTTTELGQSGSSTTPMGSLVYAIPDVSLYHLKPSHIANLTLLESVSTRNKSSVPPFVKVVRVLNTLLVFLRFWLERRSYRLMSAVA